ncbi:MAG TPA: molybdate ABC transporter substrate-binding protein, partial [Solirubrobacteraceae bacterium]|nr:molybdate ABC transporter substrate-binding protein [Solirubrobacteraceae bacterium]
MGRVRLALAPVLLACLVAAGGCGANGPSDMRVAAAASLRAAFTDYSLTLKGTRTSFEFAGSDALAAQIEQGVDPDVFASANTRFPQLLYAKGLVERPVVFAANRLVLAVPRTSKVDSLAGVERAGVRIAVGTATVPVGSYTAEAIARLPATRRRAVLANMRDREPDVTGIVGKLSQGAVDAGFLYATDVAAAAGSIRAIELPASMQPVVRYGIAVVSGSAHRAQAQAFVAGLLRGSGRSAL